MARARGDVGETQAARQPTRRAPMQTDAEQVHDPGLDAWAPRASIGGGAKVPQGTPGKHLGLK